MTTIDNGSNTVLVHGLFNYKTQSAGETSDPSEPRSHHLPIPSTIVALPAVLLQHFEFCPGFQHLQSLGSIFFYNSHQLKNVCYLALSSPHVILWCQCMPFTHPLLSNFTILLESYRVMELYSMEAGQMGPKITTPIHIHSFLKNLGTFAIFLYNLCLCMVGKGSCMLAVIGLKQLEMAELYGLISFSCHRVGLDK